MAFVGLQVEVEVEVEVCDRKSAERMARMRIVANGAIEQTRSRRDRLQTAAARNEE